MIPLFFVSALLGVSINTVSNTPSSFDPEAGETIQFDITFNGSVTDEATQGNPGVADAQGGWRVEIYNSNGSLVRRLLSREIHSDPDLFQFDGFDDNGETLPYGSYTARIYTTMENPQLQQIVESQYPVKFTRDIFFKNNVLYWVNQRGAVVAQSDPTGSAPTLLYSFSVPLIGSTPSGGDQGLSGIAVNSQGDIFVSDVNDNANNNLGSRIVRIQTDGTMDTLWFTAGTSSVAEDIYAGLYIDEFDSLYISCNTNANAWGADGAFEGVIVVDADPLSPNFGQEMDVSNDIDVDCFDVTVEDSPGNRVWVNAVNDVSQFNDRNNLGGINIVDVLPGAGADDERGLFYLNGVLYSSSDDDRQITKFTPSGSVIYTVDQDVITDWFSEELPEIQVDPWNIAAGVIGNDTYVFLGMLDAGGNDRRINRIVILKEAADGKSAGFFRDIDSPRDIRGPRDLSIDGNNNVLVVSSTTSTIKRFNSAGNPNKFSNPAGESPWGAIGGFTDDDSSDTLLEDPGGVTVDENGYIYVNSFEDENDDGGPDPVYVKRFNSDGSAFPDATAPWPVDATTLTGGGAGVNNLWEHNMALIAGSLNKVSDEASQVNIRIPKDDDPLTGYVVTSGVLDDDITDVDPGSFIDQDSPAGNPADWEFIPEAVYTLDDDGSLFIQRPTWFSGEQEIYTTQLFSDIELYHALEIDEFGEVYAFRNNSSANQMILYRFNAEADERPDSDATQFQVGEENLFEYDFGEGIGDDNFNFCAAMEWLNDGKFQQHPTITNAQGRKKWYNDMWMTDNKNNRMKRYRIFWEDVLNYSFLIQPSNDTPTVVSDDVQMETSAVINGLVNVSSGTATIIILFNNNMDSTIKPTVEIIPSVGPARTVTEDTYFDNRWEGKVFIPTGIDGTAEVKVSGARDTSGLVFPIDPDPARSDDSGSDSFKPFIIDATAPSVTITDPAETGTTSENFYTVKGTTSEANAFVEIFVYDAETGGNLTDTTDVTSDASGNWQANVNLGAAGTFRWVSARASDQLGNVSSLTSPRKPIERINFSAGSAEIIEDADIQVTDKRQFTIRYTASSNVSNGTLALTVPTDWTSPQISLATTNGYTTADTPGTTVSGQVFTVTGVDLDIGETFDIRYGDTVTSSFGKAGPGADATLGNTLFSLTVQNGSSTTVLDVPPRAGGQLYVNVFDSPVVVTVVDSWPSVNLDSQVVKGDANIFVYRLRFINSNLGNHTDRITNLKLRIEDQTGAGVVPSTALSRIVSKFGSEVYADLSSGQIPTSGSVINLDLTSGDPFEISQNSSKDMEIYIDISPTASAKTIRFDVTDTTAVTATDKGSADPIGVIFAEDLGPTDTREIIGLVPADTLFVGTTDKNTGNTVRGATSLDVLNVVLTNSSNGDSPVNSLKVTDLQLRFLGENGSGAVPARIVSKVKLIDLDDGTQYGSIGDPSIPLAGDTLAVSLTGLSIASDDSATLRVMLDIWDTALEDSFNVELQSSYVTAKDIVTGNPPQVLDDPNDPDPLPFTIDTVTILDAAVVTNVTLELYRSGGTIPIRGGNISVGEKFEVHAGYSVKPGGSDAWIIPADSDLIFFIDTTDSTSEFTITPPSARRLFAGGIDTLVYTVQQDNGVSAGSLTVNNDTGGKSDTYPVIFDWLDRLSPDPLRLYALEPDSSFATATIVSKKIDAAAVSIGAQFANPSEQNVLALAFTVTNNSPPAATFDSVIINSLSTSDTLVVDVNIFRDDGDGVFEPTTDDTLLSTGTDTFGTDGTLTFSSLGESIGGGATVRYWVSVDMDTFGITDGVIIDMRIPVNGVGTSDGNADDFILDSPGTVPVEVVATMVDLSPDSSLNALNANRTITIRATDQFGNLDGSKNDEAGTQGYNLNLTMSFTPTTGGYFTATTLSSPSPSPGIGVTSINGSLSNGLATITVTDTLAEVLTISPSSTLSDSTAQAEFAALITVSADDVNGQSAGVGAEPGETNVTVLKFTVTNSTGSDQTIDSLTVNSLNTLDSEIDSVVLRVDLNGNGSLDPATDGYLGGGNFSGGSLLFDINQLVQDGGDSVFFISYDIETSVTDGNIIDASLASLYLDNGDELVGGSPLNSSPTDDPDIEVTADRVVIFSQGISVSVQTTVGKQVEARDKYGNVDKDYSGPIEIDLTGDGYFLSSSLAGEQIDPNSTGDQGRIKGSLNGGGDTIAFSDNTVEVITVQCDVAPSPVVIAKNVSITQQFTGFLGDVEFHRSDQSKATGYLITEKVFLGLTDKNRNLDSLSKDTVTVTLQDRDNNDTELVVLTESANASGFFNNFGGPGISLVDSVSTTPFNGQFEVQQGDTIYVFYQDPNDAADSDEDEARVQFSPDLAKSRVSATNSSTGGGNAATVIVTAIDAETLPVEGISVVISSSRGGLDTIDTVNATTNSLGQAEFRVSSTITGFAIITATLISYGTVTEQDTIEFFAFSNVNETTIGGGFGASRTLSSPTADGSAGEFIHSARYSSDGTQIAYLGKYTGTSDSYGVFVMNADGSGLTQLTNTTDWAIYPASSLAWADVSGGAAEEILVSSDDFVGVNTGLIGPEIFWVDPTTANQGNDTTRRINPMLTDTVDFSPANSFYEFDIQPGSGQDTLVTTQAFDLYIFDRTLPQPIPMKRLTKLWDVAKGLKYRCVNPRWSPDGTRIAFTLLDANDLVPVTNTGTVKNGTIYVIKDLATIPDSGINSLSDPHLVKVSHNSTGMAWQPNWNGSGDVISYAYDENGVFSWRDYHFGYYLNSPQKSVDAFVGADFNVYFRYYNKASDTAPYPPTLVKQSGSDNEFYMSWNPTGDSVLVMSMNAVKQTTIEAINIVPQALITSKGGVLLDNGRPTVIVPDGEQLAQGVTITVADPGTVPPASGDTMVLTGAGREFFPDITFSNEITIILYYSDADIAEADEIPGVDSDGDGLSDATEASLAPFWYNSSSGSWERFQGVVDDVNNRLIFTTTHFSIYNLALDCSISPETTVIEVDPLVIADGQFHSFRAIIKNPVGAGLNGKSVEFVSSRSEDTLVQPDTVTHTEDSVPGIVWFQLASSTPGTSVITLKDVGAVVTVQFIPQQYNFIVSAPKIVQANDSFTVTITLVDAFGNPVPVSDSIAISVVRDGTFSTLETFTSPQLNLVSGLASDSISISETGTYRVQVITPYGVGTSEAFEIGDASSTGSVKIELVGAFGEINKLTNTDTNVVVRGYLAGDIVQTANSADLVLDLSRLTGRTSDSVSLANSFVGAVADWTPVKVDTTIPGGSSISVLFNFKNDIIETTYVQVFQSPLNAATFTFSDTNTGLVAKVHSPANLIDTPFIITLQRRLLSEDTIAAANNSVSPSMVNLLQGYQPWSITLNTITGSRVTQFDQPITIDLPYTDAMLGNIPEENLKMLFLDEGIFEWVVQQNSTVDLATNIVSLSIPHLSIFTIAGAASASLNNVVIYPNPWKPSSPTAAFSPSNPAFGVKIANLTPNTRIRIFNIAGELIDEMFSSAGGRVRWDLRNQSGTPVASGVYIVVLTNDIGEKVTRKFTIIK